MVARPASRAREAFGFYRDLTQAAPDELTVYMSLSASPDTPDDDITLAMVARHCGDPASAEADLKPLRQFGPPAADLIQPMPSPMSGLAIVPYPGAVARVDSTATAFAHLAIACSSSRSGRTRETPGRTSPGPRKRSAHSART
jgi:hypothetical protein